MDQYPTVASIVAVGMSGVGTIKAKTGKSYTVQYSINAEGFNGPVHMTLIDGGKIRDIFYSNINGSNF